MEEQEQKINTLTQQQPKRLRNMKETTEDGQSEEGRLKEEISRLTTLVRSLDQEKKDILRNLASTQEHNSKLQEEMESLRGV